MDWKRWGKLGCAECTKTEFFQEFWASSTMASQKPEGGAQNPMDFSFFSLRRFFFQAKKLHNHGIDTSFRWRIARNFPHEIFPTHWKYRPECLTPKLLHLPPLPRGWEIIPQEEDHLRLVFLANLSSFSTFTRLGRDWETLLQDTDRWCHDSPWGFLTSCPTNFGTAERWSIQWKGNLILPKPREWESLLPSGLEWKVENVAGKPILSSSPEKRGIRISLKNLDKEKKIVFFNFAVQFQNLLEKQFCPKPN